MNTVCWPDAHLEDVHIVRDTVTVRIRGHLDQVRTIRCDGHIGLSLGAVWDEGVIESGQLLDQHPLIDRSIAELAARPGVDFNDAGNPTRNQRSWRALVITLVDGCRVEIAAANFTAI